jgi:hypothetical protein
MTMIGNKDCRCFLSSLIVRATRKFRRNIASQILLSADGFLNDAPNFGLEDLQTIALLAWRKSLGGHGTHTEINGSGPFLFLGSSWIAKGMDGYRTATVNLG